MITLDGLTKAYGQNLAVDDLSIEISSGEVCVLIGPSGCGKTTTLRMINRLVEPTGGRVLIDGKDTRTFAVQNLRLSIGYAIQNVGLFPHLTVAQNIAVAPQLLHWDKARIVRRVDELLALVGLPPSEYAHKYPRTLSGGEAQRVGVARALAADPPVLLMDEPFGAVDPLTRERLQAQFARIQQELKKTVVLVTHDLDEAIRLADRIAILQSGKLVQYDTPEMLLARPANRFVKSFVGADRALKRLSRKGINSSMKAAVHVNVGLSRNEALAGREAYKWFWVVDDGQRLLGWANRDDLLQSASVRAATHFAEAEDISVREGATLRDALSRMLGLGFKYLPVIDGDGRLIGELALGDVEKETKEGEP